MLANMQRQMAAKRPAPPRHATPRQAARCIAPLQFPQQLALKLRLFACTARTPAAPVVYSRWGAGRECACKSEAAGMPLPVNEEPLLNAEDRVEDQTPAALLESLNSDYDGSVLADVPAPGCGACPSGGCSTSGGVSGGAW